MKKRIFIAMLVVTLLSGVFYALLVTGALPDYARSRALSRMQQELNDLRTKAREQGGPDPAFLSRVVTTGRLTLIGADGSVLYDSDADADQMENHLQRPEVKAALIQGSGSDQRLSATTGEDYLYYAQRLGGTQVLRLAQPLQMVRLTSKEILPWLFGGLMLSLIAALIVSSTLARQFSRSIALIDLDRPEDSRAYDELSPLIGRLSQQNQQVSQQMTSLRQKQLEMDALLDGMSEGFMALDKRRRIMSINQSAARMLNTKADYATGRTLAEVSRKPELIRLLDELYEVGAAAVTMPWENRSYALSANLVEDSGKAVILLRDVTQMVEGDNMRKRFTANVSHELRTPLTTICGYSEMLQSGMVKEDDKKDFVGRIARESRRMLALVEDILRLSRLDEGYPGGQFKRVSLHEAAQRAIASLTPVAEKKGVALSLTGEKLNIMGDPTLLDELVFNLVDNAIKYNRQDGRVDLRIGHKDGSITLAVQDTGVGIERSQQDKIFERFFRTDNSRSKETGGTGLGLSIVKHSVEYHNAQLQLESEVGQGTTITIYFPSASASQMAIENATKKKRRTSKTKSKLKAKQQELKKAVKSTAK